MSGTKQTEFTVSGQSTDWSNPDAARIYIERIVEPLLKKVRNTVNQLARDVLSATASTKVDAKYGLVLVDASKGPVTLTLVTPTANFHPITVVKVDSSANAVVVQVSGGALISGSATDTFSKQWEVTQYESDGVKYVRTFGGNMSLFGDVTGRADSNTVSALQGITLTASGGNAPTTGQVLMYNGTVWLPISRNLAVIDNTNSPVGNWSFNVSPSVVSIPDLSGNGAPLTIESGTLRTTTIHPTLGGVLLDGATDFTNATPQAQLTITADLTVLVLLMFTDIPAGGSEYTIFSYGNGGGTFNNHVLYQGSFTSASVFHYYSEHGPGAPVGDNFSTLSTGGRFQPFLLGMTRDAAGNLEHWANGIFVGSPFGTTTLPTGGSTSQIRVGSNNIVGSFAKMIVSSLAIFNKVLTPAQMLYHYNQTLGGAYGLK